MTTQYYKKITRLVILALTVSNLTLLSALCDILSQQPPNTRLEPENVSTPAILEDLRGVEPVFESTTELIIRLSIEKGFNVKTALAIADCESETGKEKYNLQGSSAKGVFMFIDRTWKHYCTGDVLNEEDNINCFIKLYNDHKNWWSCKV
jgi:hypothetical protein